MLSDPKITAFIPTIQIGQARRFYKDVLGLELVSQDDYAIEFQGSGAILRITFVNEFKPHPFAVLGFKIDDINSQVKSLSEKGVAFEKYDSLEMNHLGIWIAPSKAKVAWFKDPDGNLLSLTEYSL